MSTASSAMMQSTPDVAQAARDDQDRREPTLSEHQQSADTAAARAEDHAETAVLDREFIAKSPGARNSGRNPWALLSILAFCAVAMYFVIAADPGKRPKEDEKPAVFETARPRARVVPAKEEEVAPTQTAQADQFEHEPPAPTREELDRRKEADEKRKQAEALKLARLKSAILVMGSHGSASAVGPAASTAFDGLQGVSDDAPESEAPFAASHNPAARTPQSADTGLHLDTNTVYQSVTNAVRPRIREDASSNDPNERFFAEKSNRSRAVVQATRLDHLIHTVLQGKLIDCVLETAIDSDLPGQLRCSTSSDVYGEAGRAVMLPAKTRMIGQYNSAVRKGQVRVFVIWQRAITPDGVDVQLDSQGTDALGRAGLGGEVDNHYLEIFGVSAMLSIIGAGASSYGVGGVDQPNSASAYRQAIQQSFAQTAQQILSPYAQIAPTIHVNQGEAIKIFVNRDLDFSNVYANQTQSKQPAYTVIQ